MPGKAIVLGASGLIGGYVTALLAEDLYYDEVVLLLRRELALSSSKVRQQIIDFDRLSEYSATINGQVIFSCLGTTKSQTPDYEQYRKIDFLYPLKIAEQAVKTGVEQFHIVSSVGADVNSSTTYLRLKGELEEALKALQFKALHIYRPSFIIGQRKKARLTDKLITPVMRLVNPILSGRFTKYRSIEATVVAKAMVTQASKNLEGVFIYESDQIQDIK